ncbi:MAG: hypothetical protein ACI8UR_000351 [Natronomonas sp.]|jgi:hypothetical protein|uniref:hypothetical protein n=1 Tax=Natronomonas sp. TaxID=2184060 RepID=UPI0039E2B8CE
MPTGGGKGFDGGELATVEREEIVATIESFLGQPPDARCRTEFDVGPASKRGGLTVVYNDNQELLLEYSLGPSSIESVPERLQVSVENRPQRFTDDPLYRLGDLDEVCTQLEHELLQLVATIYDCETIEELDEGHLLWPNRSNGMGLFAVSIMNFTIVFASGFRVPDSLVEAYQAEAEPDRNVGWRSV